jgi:hypothetical protein
MRLCAALILALALSACSSKPMQAEPAPTQAKAPPAPAAAQPEAAAMPSAPDKASSRIECSVKGDQRTIEVRAKDKGCEVVYGKGGKESVVASAARGSKHCEDVQGKMKQRLEGAGFQCK